ncbi:MAG: hypothetical protein FH751_14200 [Firmicutes bacterium]|nr:hypothetical protein [Bacillota bacterium]
MLKLCIDIKNKKGVFNIKKSILIIISVIIIFAIIVSIINRPITGNFEELILDKSEDKKFNYLRITSKVGLEIVEKETRDMKNINKLLSYFKILDLVEYTKGDYKKKGESLEDGFKIYFNNSNNYDYMYLSLSYEKSLYIKFHTLTDHGSEILEKKYLIKNSKLDENFIKKIYKSLKVIDD